MTGSRRFTAQYRRTDERELTLQFRIARALRRLGYSVAILRVDGPMAVRDNGVNLEACIGGYRVKLCIVLPGHTPDARTLAHLASDPYACIVSGVADAVRLLSVGTIPAYRLTNRKLRV